MNKMASALIASTCICMVLISPATLAIEIPVIDEPLDTKPANYETWVNASANATANSYFGSVGGTDGLIFEGSWDVPASGVEDSVGGIYPNLPSVDDFQFDPGDTEGIANIRWTIDAEVISDNMVPPDQGIFVQLLLYQLQSDFSVLAYVTGGAFVVTGTSESFNITSFESDFGPIGARPDFSATGLPIAFGLQIGARYPREIKPDAFYVDGVLVSQNWKVFVNPGGIFRDSFENPIPVPKNATPGNSLQTDKDDCLCPAPSGLAPQPLNMP